MTMRVTMTTTVLGEAGSLLLTGQTYTVSDEFGLSLVGRGVATDTDNVRGQDASGSAPARWASMTKLARPDASTVSVAAQTVLWANRPTAPDIYDQIFATDIGPSGTTFWWTGTRWKVFAPAVLAENGAIITGLAQTAEQYLGGLGPIPAGVVQPGDVLAYYVGLGKNGTTDAFGATTALRLGAAGTIADTVVLTSNLSGIVLATTRSSGFEKWLRFESATTLRGLGPNNASPSWSNVGSGAAPETVQTVLDVTANAWRIGVSTSMGGATNAPQLTYQRLVLMP